MACPPCWSWVWIGPGPWWTGTDGARQCFRKVSFSSIHTDTPGLHFKTFHPRECFLKLRFRRVYPDYFWTDARIRQKSRFQIYPDTCKRHWFPQWFPRSRDPAKVGRGGLGVSECFTVPCNTFSSLINNYHYITNFLRLMIAMNSMHHCSGLPLGKAVLLLGKSKIIAARKRLLVNLPFGGFRDVRRDSK